MNDRNIFDSIVFAELHVLVTIPVFEILHQFASSIDENLQGSYTDSIFAMSNQMISEVPNAFAHDGN